MRGPERRPPTGRVSVVLDTDGGTDDALALWWATQDPRVDLRGVIATAGDLGIDTALAVVRQVLTAAGRYDVPVARGATEALGQSPVAHGAEFLHGSDGLGGHGHLWPSDGCAVSTESGAALLARLASEDPGGIVLVTLAPLSTLATALRTDAGLAARLRDLVVMGGAVACPGNVTASAEANVARDPIAASEVVAAQWARRPLLVGLDVTEVATLDTRVLALANRGLTPAARMMAAPLAALSAVCAGRRPKRGDAFPCHDLVALVAAVDPTVVIDECVVPLAIDVGGSAAWGTTVADLRPHPRRDGDPRFRTWRVAMAVDHERVTAAAHLIFSQLAMPRPAL